MVVAGDTLEDMQVMRQVKLVLLGCEVAWQAKP